METIQFQCQLGISYVQPQHIIGCFAQENGGCVVAIQGGFKFHFPDKEPKEVWDMILDSYQTIQQEKALKMAQYIQAVQAKPPSGDVN